MRAVALGGLVALGACEPTSATDREEGMAELRDVARRNAKFAPRIPQSERVGCDVCPIVCKNHDLHRLPIDELFRDYRHHAETAYGWGGYKRSSHLELHRISCIAKRSGPEVQQAFMDYQYDELLHVQIATADMMLHRDIEPVQALVTLHRVRQNSPYALGHAGFNAEILLKIWRHNREPPLRRAKQIMAERRARQKK